MRLVVPYSPVPQVGSTPENDIIRPVYVLVSRTFRNPFSSLDSRKYLSSGLISEDTLYPAYLILPADRLPYPLYLPTLSPTNTFIIVLYLIIIIASFLTTIKSMWELSRIVRKRRAAKALTTEAKSTYVLLK